MAAENENFHIPSITLAIKLQKNIILSNKCSGLVFSTH